MSLKKLKEVVKHSGGSTTAFDLGSTRHHSQILRLLTPSKCPQISIHFEILGSTPQIVHLDNSNDLRIPSSAPELAPGPQVFPKNQIPGAAAEISERNASDIRTVDAVKLYAIGSYAKIFINLAWLRLMKEEKYKHFRLSWKKSACDLFNELRLNREKSTIQRTYGNPTIRQLLTHENGFAPMNRFLLAPDGCFIMSVDEFLRVAPLITEDRYAKTYPHRGWVEYSNGNHIFAGLILEEITRMELQDALHELVFSKMNLTTTLLSESSLKRRTAATPTAVMVPGFRVSSIGLLTAVEANRYLSDTIEKASFGVRSSLEDIATLNRKLLRSIEKLEDGFSYEDMEDFFAVATRTESDIPCTLAGCFGSLDSRLPGMESPNRSLLRGQKYQPYRLGKRKHGPSCDTYHKAGYIDGFGINVYLMPKFRTFVIVVANATGFIDVAESVARYILQEAFSLSPNLDVVDLAIREGRVYSQSLRILEDRDNFEGGLHSDMAYLAGTFRHTRYEQMITISREGEVRIHGRAKSSSSMRIVQCSNNTFRIIPGPHGFGIERWDEWVDLDFTFKTINGKRYLIGGQGQHHYEMIDQ